MMIIDLHQDLMSHIRFYKRFGQACQTSFGMLEQSTVDTVVATAFPLPKSSDQRSFEVNDLIEEELLLYKQHVSQNICWHLIKTPSDLLKSGKKLLLHVEGLNSFSGAQEDWDRLDRWYEIGLRSLATHWNIDNDLGAGTLNVTGKLSRIGEEVIAYAERKNIMLDFAHMGRQTFIDAAVIVKRPIYVSHGNADTICPNIRNYTDEQLKIIAESGGVIGVFAPNTFVVGKERKGTLINLISHIDYIVDLIGIDHVAIGSDFGGIISGQLENFGSVADYPKLVDALVKKKYPLESIEKILYQNAQRIIKNHLGKN